MRRASLVLSLVFAGGCALVLGVDGVGYGERDAGPPPSDRGDDDAPAADAGEAGDAAPDGPIAIPSFCDGITFYAPFEGTGDSFDQPTALASGGPTYTDGGLVGAALRLRGAQEIQWELAFGGARIAKTAQGSVAVWLRPAVDLACDGSDGGSGYGAVVADNAAHINLPHVTYDYSSRQFSFQLATTLPDGSPTPASFNMPLCGAINYWHAGGFNQLTATWRELTGGAFYLNGGERAGVSVVTASLAWKGLEDASRLDLDYTKNPYDADFDELALWDRELSAEEVLALYHAQWPTPRALRDLCPCAAGTIDRCLDGSAD